MTDELQEVTGQEAEAEESMEGATAELGAEQTSAEVDPASEREQTEESEDSEEGGDSGAEESEQP